MFRDDPSGWVFEADLTGILGEHWLDEDVRRAGAAINRRPRDLPESLAGYVRLVPGESLVRRSRFGRMLTLRASYPGVPTSSFVGLSRVAFSPDRRTAAVYDQSFTAGWVVVLTPSDAGWSIREWIRLWIV